MRLQHTAQFALSFNVKIVDDAGRDVSAFIMPVVYLWCWLPGWLYNLVASPKKREKPTRRQSSPKTAMLATAGNGGCGRRSFSVWAVLFGPGWRDDLRLIMRAGWLLVRDRRLYDGAPI